MIQLAFKVAIILMAFLIYLAIRYMINSNNR